MSQITTFGTVLKRFQEEAVDNGVQVLRTCMTELAKVQGTANYQASKKLIVADVGAVLFEAPTGSGKTLMAGHVAEQLSHLHNTEGYAKVLWFWVAPFAGLIDQAGSTIRAEFDTLRQKNPGTDREPADLKSGDVFVMTWSSVAVANEATRKVRTGTEVLPSVDDLVTYARSQGFVIGIVVDESHHGFKQATQAFTFYKEILAPELTILVTATPKDKDIDAFVKATGITNLRRVTVSRQQAIDERLIKEGVKVAIFKAPSDVESLIDFRRTALKQAVITHRKIKQMLIEEGLSVTPLLLVQVDSTPDSVELATQWLKEHGFRTEGDSQLIRSHTADEPDPYLSTIAADETVEVLIFKMAVAIGFDAPRAFTLVSFRTSRDEDFGIQIVGRILRVDRRLQIIKDLPKALNNGYVFLSDNSGQTGLASAAQRINAVRAELASVSSNVAVVAVGDDEPDVQTIGSDRQTSLLPTEGRHDARSSAERHQEPEQNGFFPEWGLDVEEADQGHAPPLAKAPHAALYYYPLQTDLGAPTAFKRAMLSLESADIVKEIVGRFRFDNDALLVAQQAATKIIMEGVEIFGNQKDRPEEIRADLAQKEIDIRAQNVLFRADDYDVINMRELHDALVQQFEKEIGNRGLEHLFDTTEKLRSGLHKILALRPLQLKLAISEAVVKFTESEDADPIPVSVESFIPLDPARLNLYAVYPADLNTWERPFAEHLDNDLSGTVLWWHRNPVRKPSSVSMPLPGQPDFYPDFVVGIQDRSMGKGILLMETKRIINDQERNALVKAQATHPDYGRVMMVYWEQQREWRVVEYDPKKDVNFLDRALRFELLAVY